MKGMKGKLLKKIKSIKPVHYLKQDRILQVSAADWFFETSPKRNSNQEVNRTQTFCNKQIEKENVIQNFEISLEPDIIDVSELMRDLEEDQQDEMEVGDHYNDDGIDKENIVPLMKRKDSVSFRENEEFPKKTDPAFCQAAAPPLPEINVSSFRRPDMNSSTLFDPNLLAAFEEAVNHYDRLIQEERKKREETEHWTRIEEENREETEQRINVDATGEEGEPPHKLRRIEENEKDECSLGRFEEKCPPGGENSVILYTTTLRGIRKTFEDCNRIRFLLESFRVIFFERDVSMHMEYREELRRIMRDNNGAIPPRLFIRGRYIGGAAEVLGMHEQGKFRVLFQGIPMDSSNGPCEGCAGVRFVMCYKCCGSNKVVAEDGLSSKCHECNENGLIVCPFCS